MTKAEWKAEGERRFGKDIMKWRFVCPSCGHVASLQDWKDAGAPANAAAFSCVGRWLGEAREAFFVADKTKPGPCNYAGGGLIGLNPLEVDGEHYFDFAEAKIGQ